MQPIIVEPRLQLREVLLDAIDTGLAPVDKARQLSLIEMGQVAVIYLYESTPGRYGIIEGRRRVENAKWAGLTKVQAIIEPAQTEKDLALKALVHNIARSRNHMNEARMVGVLLQAGMSQKDIAARLHVTQGTISQLKDLLNLISPLQDKLEAGDNFTFSAARKICKLPPDIQQDLAGQSKITITDADNALRQWQAAEVDLSTISIPELPALDPPANDSDLTCIDLTADQLNQLKQGFTVEIEIEGQPYYLAKG